MVYKETKIEKINVTSLLNTRVSVRVINKYNFMYEFEKEGHVKLIIANTGADFYANKSLLAYLGGKTIKQAMLKRNTQMLKTL